jgi:hypothetical protein
MYFYEIIWRCVCGGAVRPREWQWLGGSGTIRRRRSVRFEWWWLESGSGSIGRVVACLKNVKKSREKMFFFVGVVFGVW